MPTSSASTLRAELEAKPDGVLDDIARRNGASLREVLDLLPEGAARSVPGTRAFRTDEGHEPASRCRLSQNRACGFGGCWAAEPGPRAMTALSYKRSAAGASGSAAAALLALLAPAALAWVALQQRPAETPAAAPPPAVMIDLAPAPVAPEAPKLDVAPGPQSIEANPPLAAKDQGEALAAAPAPTTAAQAVDDPRVTEQKLERQPEKETPKPQASPIPAATAESEAPALPVRNEAPVALPPPMAPPLEPHPSVLPDGRRRPPSESLLSPWASRRRAGRRSRSNAGRRVGSGRRQSRQITFTRRAALQPPPPSMSRAL